MRAKVFIAIVCTSLILSLQLTAQTQHQNLGLISELLQIKCESESALAQSVHQTDSANTLRKYQITYRLLNSMISQLEADLIASNSLSEYKKLDKLLKDNSIETCTSNNQLIDKYIKTIQAASSLWKDLSTAGSKGLVGNVGNVVDIANTTVGIIKDINDMKKEKVKAICQCLDNTRLSTNTDILKPKTPSK